MLIYGLNTIFRTGWIKTTLRRQAGRNNALIESHNKYYYFFNYQSVMPDSWMKRLNSCSIISSFGHPISFLASTMSLYGPIVFFCFRYISRMSRFILFLWCALPNFLDTAKPTCRRSDFKKKTRKQFPCHFFPV